MVLQMHGPTEKDEAYLGGCVSRLLWLYKYHIYQFIKPFLDNKMSIFEEYGAFKTGFFFIFSSNIEKNISFTKQSR